MLGTDGISESVQYSVPPDRRINLLSHAMLRPLWYNPPAMADSHSAPLTRRSGLAWLVGGVAVAGAAVWGGVYAYTTWLERSFDPEMKRTPLNAPFITSPQDVVDQMLELAELDENDVIYDLGCGDGRIVITAAKRYGCRGIGYEYDPKIAEMAREHARAEKVDHLVTIEQRDIFTLDKTELNQATVITLYLLPWMNEKLLPRLAELDEGKTIVSHDWDLPGIKPDRQVEIDSQDDENPAVHRIFVWRTPLKKKT